MVPSFAALNITSQPVDVTGWLPSMPVLMLTAFLTTDRFVLIITVILGFHLIFIIRNIKTKSAKSFRSCKELVCNILRPTRWHKYQLWHHNRSNVTKRFVTIVWNTSDSISVPNFMIMRAGTTK